MTIATELTDQQHDTDEIVRAAAGHRFNLGWFIGWAFLTIFTWFEVVKHGFVNGDAMTAVLLTTTAVGSFVAPDLTFIIGVGEPTRPGFLARRAVPYYNAMHRFVVPLVATSIIGIAAAPLGTGMLAAFIGGLSWMAHIAMDRASGYGLRNSDGSR